MELVNSKNHFNQAKMLISKLFKMETNLSTSD